MRFLRYYIFLIGVFLFGVLRVNAASITPRINMDQTIQDGYLTIVLGFKDQEVISINHDMQYDTDKLKLIDITGLEEFQIEEKPISSEKSTQTVSISVTNSTSYYDTNYAVITFEVTDDFEPEDTARIFFKNYVATSSDGINFYNQGKIMTLIRDNANTMEYLLEDITNMTGFDLWLDKNIFKLIICFIIFIVAIIVIVNFPSKKTFSETRDDKMRKQIKEENYKNNEYIAPVTINKEYLEKFDKESPKEEKVIDIFEHNATLGQMEATQEIPKLKKDIPKLKEEKKEEKATSMKENGEDLAIFQPMFEEENKDNTDDKYDTL